jgi:hypothetical protein
MMPQPPQQRPARMPSGPSPTMGGGMPNRPDMLRQQAEQTLPSMPPMGVVVLRWGVALQPVVLLL